MKIAKYISDLLYDYECVVIPGLGGFLSNDKPASIHSQTHSFRPPYKQIVFNAYLKANDGLLINYLSREEGISYKEAKNQVDQFARQCDNALNAGKHIHFENIGDLYKNEKGMLVFEQDTTINYNADAFGLSSFVSPAIKRETPEEKLRRVVNVDKKALSGNKAQKEIRKAKKVPSSGLKISRRAKTIMFIFLAIVLMAGWAYINKKAVNAYYDNYSSVLPLFSKKAIPSHKRPTHNTAKTAIKQPAKKENKQPQPVKITKTAVTVSPAKAVAAKSTPVKPARKTISHKSPSPAAVSPVSHRRYYIIAGAFKHTYNVKKLVYSLKQEGYDALVAGVTPAGLYRVAYHVSDSYRKSMKLLRKIRQQENPSAWLLVK